MKDDFDIKSLVEDSEKVTAVFGEWPTFHDAEILTIVLDRGPDFSSRSQSLTAEFYVFTMAPPKAGSKYFDLINRSIVKLQFTSIELESLDDFNNQNSIWLP